MSDLSESGIEQESASLYGYYRSTGVGGWIPVNTEWEPNIGQWYYGAFDCAEWGLKREIAKAVDERALATTEESTEPSDLREMAGRPSLVNQCTHCGCRVGLDRHIDSINGRYYAVCYDCSDEKKTEQTTLVQTDGGCNARCEDTETDRECR